jgi:hypothetical protein
MREKPEELSIIEKRAQKIADKLFTYAFTYRVDIRAEIISDDLIFIPKYIVEEGSPVHNLFIIDPIGTKETLNKKLEEILKYLGVDFKLKHYLTFYRAG